MSASVIWLDSEHSKIFKISTEGVTKISLQQDTKGTHGDHHNSYKKNAEEHYFADVAKALANSEEVMIFGSGVTKNHFKSYLEKHHSPLADNVIGVEPLELLSDNQILEASRKYFKKFHTFNSAV